MLELSEAVTRPYKPLGANDPRLRVSNWSCGLLFDLGISLLIQPDL